MKLESQNSGSTAKIFARTVARSALRQCGGDWMVVTLDRVIDEES